MARWVALLFSIALLSSGAFAEQQPFAFEVASVKPNVDRAPLTIQIPPRGLVIAQNVTLKTLIDKAYNLRPYQLMDGPEWLTKDRFDISAKAPDDAPVGRAREMLQSLLAERFKLRVRRETRIAPLYELRVVREDGALGKQLQRVTYDCTPFFANEADPDADTSPRNGRGNPAVWQVHWSGQPRFSRSAEPRCRKLHRGSPRTSIALSLTKPPSRGTSTRL